MCGINQICLYAGSLFLHFENIFYTQSVDYFTNQIYVEVLNCKGLTMKKGILFLSILLIVAACGGGGGGDSVSSSISYDGRTDPAALTSTNAPAVNDETEKAGAVAYGIDESIRSAIGDKGILAVAYDAARDDIAIIAGNGDISSRASSSVSNTISGTCGGYASYTGTGDAVTGAMNVDITYYNYCKNNNTVNGSVSFDGYFNYYTQRIISGTYLFSNVTYTNVYYSESMNGTISFTSNSLTINCDYVDAIGTKYRSQNFTISNSGGLYSFSGRMYYQDYGYVDITTTTAFTIDSYGNIISGEMVLTGLSSAVKVTYLSSSRTIYVDADGNGIYETAL